MSTSLLVALLSVNVLAFLAFGWDKLAARRGSRRVPERRLLLLALALGAPGAWLGVRIFRHKTRKRAFRAWLVLATFWNVAAVAAYVYWISAHAGPAG